MDFIRIRGGPLHFLFPSLASARLPDFAFLCFSALGISPILRVSVSLGKVFSWSRHQLTTSDIPQQAFRFVWGVNFLSEKGHRSVSSCCLLFCGFCFLHCVSDSVCPHPAVLLCMLILSVHFHWRFIQNK